MKISVQADLKTKLMDESIGELLGSLDFSCAERRGAERSRSKSKYGYFFWAMKKGIRIKKH